MRNVITIIMKETYTNKHTHTLDSNKRKGQSGMMRHTASDFCFVFLVWTLKLLSFVTKELND